MDLLVCQLSGDQSLIKDYQEGPQILCSQDGEVIERNNMMCILENGNILLKMEINPFCASVNNVLHFLTEFVDSNLGYPGINTAKSALSSVVTLSDSNFSIGKHQSIKRFMRGVYNLCPSVRRYKETFDAAQVLNYLRQIDIEEI